MPYYRVRLHIMSPVGTPLISGTLWGHLAWAVRYLDGEDGFRKWLENQSEMPWLLSSAMPEGHLPRPLLKPELRKDDGTDLPTLERLKMVRKKNYISEEDFLSLRNAMTEKVLVDLIVRDLQESVYERDKEKGPSGNERESNLGISFRQARNRIDRNTGRTPEIGGLYFLEDVIFPSRVANLQFFVFTEKKELERLSALLGFVGENGYGRKASIGKGAFDFEILEEVTLFDETGNRAMSLSHGIATENMEDCRCKLHTHFGKLGGHYARGKFSPFKYPVLMMRPGATFNPGNSGPFGKLIDGVHHDPALSGIKHHALHLPIYFKEVIQ